MRVALVILCLSLCAITASLASEDTVEDPLPLPDVPSTGARELKLGEQVALDDLGPLIVNADGSLRRIANWATLSEAEQATALRRLAKRNRERLATIEQQQQQQQEQQQQAAGEL